MHTLMTSFWLKEHEIIRFCSEVSRTRVDEEEPDDWREGWTADDTEESTGDGQIIDSIEPFGTKSNRCHWSRANLTGEKEAINPRSINRHNKNSKRIVHFQISYIFLVAGFDAAAVNILRISEDELVFSIARPRNCSGVSSLSHCGVLWWQKISEKSLIGGEDENGGQNLFNLKGMHKARGDVASTHQ